MEEEIFKTCTTFRRSKDVCTSDLVEKVKEIISLDRRQGLKGIASDLGDTLVFFIDKSDFIERINTGDETWVYAYEPEKKKRQSLDCRSPGYL
ncbi:hypothetical protein LAZ67_X003660 [Cordylochernes scorpioides]|uniref:Uncharacterized protein n=1 Tax=Cordylochernes scorpioides TaxID=51811 RepID=A0ABY6LYG2_9ARAC|nr:hypothetical protein LAZ67_X003660 [Cordylochernes scorpioides]